MSACVVFVRDPPLMLVCPALLVPLQQGAEQDDAPDLTQKHVFADAQFREGKGENSLSCARVRSPFQQWAVHMFS